MITIIVAKKSGFCLGVKRALDMAYKEASTSNEPVFTFGPLVHNDQVISYLENLGIERIDRVEDAPPGSHIILRSHGVGPNVIEKIKSRGLTIIDATCIKVKNVQDFAKSLKEGGYALIILGAPDHPEIKAIREYVEDKALVIETLDEIIDPLFDPVPEKVGLVCQTTLSFKFFEEAVAKIKLQIPHLEVHNTICGATEKRQKEARKVAENVDLMLVIGSPVSSNTSKLAELCSCYSMMKQIETEKDIDKNWLHKDMSIGVSAGASTPDWIIKNVLEDIIKFGTEIDNDVKVINGDRYLCMPGK
jgi:(E)-4-hydroxy-3-methyl-but-2-enyl pyrophosphate reductase